MIYTDDKDAKILVSTKHQINGKPDYIFRQYNSAYLPVELKNKTARRPYLGDVMQLAMYFLLIEEHYGKVNGGILEYKNKSFYVRNTKRLRRKLLQQLEDIKQMEETGALNRFKKDKTKCKSCMHRTICKQ